MVTRADGRQTVEAFASRARAQSVVDSTWAQVAGRTVSVALDAYEVSLRERSLAGGSIVRARYHLERLLAPSRAATSR